MILWAAVQHFVIAEALVGTMFAFWIGFLALRGPTQKPYRRIVKQTRNTMLLRPGRRA
ncbi:hypothetical protein [Deinococcus altitudinis]|uniref:hypothetical protein n=1 Tax=Deinococcus altitudinis TaxID=468914 RepID=UPI003892B662